ncbi:hypothetical protein JC221_209 [Yersinia phage JC221]|nr:hypothetical protein JC221_209 [Yersinia phage JC221]
MIGLKLDTNALLSLFPEGSQARLDLQAGIIANVVSSVIGKKVSEEIGKAVNDEVLKQIGYLDIDNLVRGHFKQYAENRWGYRSIIDANPAGIRELSAKVKSTIEHECSSIIDDIRREAQNKAKEELIANESKFIEDTTKNLTTVVRKEIIKQVNTEWKDLIDEAIKAKLFPEETPR